MHRVRTMQTVRGPDIDPAALAAIRSAYRSLHERIRRGRPQRIDPTGFPVLPEPEDTIWATPEDGVEACLLLEELSKTARVICTATAAEMVLPFYEDFTRHQSSAARDAIDAIWQWLTGGNPNLEPAELAVREANAWLVGNGAHTERGGMAAINALDSIAWALEVPSQQGHNEKVAACDAVLMAQEAWSQQPYETGRSYRDPDAFWRLWWSNCRRRLAVRNPQTVELAAQWPWHKTPRWTTGSPGVSAYEQIEERLRGERKVVDPLAQAPGVPEDLTWPTPSAPTSRTPGFGLQGELREVFVRMSPSSVIRCTLLAAEMVWPILQEAGERAREEDPPRPAAFSADRSRYRLDRVRQWLQTPQETRSRHTEEEMFGGWHGMGQSPFMGAPMRVYYAVYFLEMAARTAQILVNEKLLVRGAEQREYHVNVLAANAARSVESAGQAYAYENYEYNQDRMRAFLDRWWSRCRVVLPVRDVESADISWNIRPVVGSRKTGGVEEPDPGTYRRLRERLAAPARVRVEPGEVVCEVPEDVLAALPDPVSQLSEALDVLPSTWARRVAVLTAAEMVLPIWTAWAPGQVPDDLRDAPQEAVDASWRRLRRELAFEEELQTAADNAARAANHVARQLASPEDWLRPGWAAASASWAAKFRADAKTAVRAASTAVSASDRPAFLRRWWERVLCRLAFRHTGEVSGPPLRPEAARPWSDYESLFARISPGTPTGYPLPDARWCDPPDDPDWPTPTVLYQVHSLLERLPVSSRVVCVQTALEVARSVWIRHATEADTALLQLVDGAIDLMHRWTLVPGDEDDLERLTDEARGLSTDLEALQAERGSEWSSAWTGAAANAASLALDSIPDIGADIFESLLAAESVREANLAVQRLFGRANEAPPWRRFYDRWWDLCRCRLALRDPESTIIEPDVEKPPVQLRAEEVFDAADGLYWYAAEHYSGMGDPLYALMNTLGYEPAPSEGPPEFGEDSERNAAAEWYSRLESGEVEPEDLRVAIEAWYTERGERYRY